MSSHLPDAVNSANGLDWKIIASAIAVGFATFITTIWGWVQGQKKARGAISGHIKAEGDIQVTGAVLQDNASLRENTQATRDLRDQIMVLIYVLETHNKLNGDVSDELKELKDFLRGLRPAQ